MQYKYCFKGSVTKLIVNENGQEKAEWYWKGLPRGPRRKTKQNRLEYQKVQSDAT